MTPDSPESIPVFVRPAPVEQPPVLDTASPGYLIHTGTPEEAQAIQAAFQKPAEVSDAAAAAFLWTAGLMLHDVLLDTLTPPANEEKPPTARPDEPKE
jgi:hypothetical protein